MLFPPGPEQPTAPNAGIPAARAGCASSEHYHGFGQVWFTLKGEFAIDGRLCPPGTMLYHPDPHFEGAFHTATGGEILIVQYPGPSTGDRSIYAGRFNTRSARRSRRRVLISEVSGPASLGVRGAAAIACVNWSWKGVQAAPRTIASLGISL